MSVITVVHWITLKLNGSDLTMTVVHLSTCCICKMYMVKYCHSAKPQMPKMQTAFPSFWYLLLFCDNSVIAQANTTNLTHKHCNFYGPQSHYVRQTQRKMSIRDEQFHSKSTAQTRYGMRLPVIFTPDL